MRGLFLLLMITLFSCNGHVVFQDRVDMDNQMWRYDNPLSFDFDIQDTTTIYDIYLDVEHSRSFGYQNLYTGISTMTPNGDTTFQRISIDLTDKMGQWLGTCKGNECSNRYIISSNQKFNSSGNYIMTFEQYSRKETLEGIKSLALTIAISED